MNENNYRAAYQYWRNTADEQTEAELRSLTTEKAIEDRFYCDLAFGTGGIRGETGAGTNRVNRYTIRKAAAGTALYLKTTFQSTELKKGVLIAYDTRCNSAAFALETARTFCTFDIPVYLFAAPAPVPLLSFTLRKENHLCGVMITASHNPPHYNGLKLYNADGGQLVPTEAEKIAPYIRETDPFSISPLPVAGATARGLLHFTGKAENAAYLNAITSRKVKNSPLTVVATPLHGAAKYLLKAALTKAGHRVFSVPAQEICDGVFATVAVPNPEDTAVFAMAETVGYENNADLLYATDPDGDRCGVSVFHKGKYVPLSGNEVGALLISYLLERNKNNLPADGYIVKTAVTGNLGEKIAAEYGVATITTPTGFKYIGEALLNKKNGTFLAGYEESGGFLAGDHCADKDGILTAVLLAEAASSLKRQNLTLIDALQKLYQTFGYEYSETETFFFPGKDGARDKSTCLYCIEANMASCGADKVEKIAGDTLIFYFGEEIRTALRPSGTEPKLKLYYTVNVKNEVEAKAKLEKIKIIFHPLINEFLPEKVYPI